MANESDHISNKLEAWQTDPRSDLPPDIGGLIFDFDEAFAPPRRPKPPTEVVFQLQNRQ